MGIIEEKKLFSEDRIDGTNGYFRWNSACSGEQKTHGIPFRTLPRRKQLEILFHGTKIEANSRHSVRNLQQKRKLLGIPYRGTKIEANSRNSFRTIPRKRKQLGILFRATKIEAKSWNAMHSCSARDWDGKDYLRIIPRVVW